MTYEEAKAAFDIAQDAYAESLSARAAAKKGPAKKAAAKKANVAKAVYKAALDAYDAARYAEAKINQLWDAAETALNDALQASAEQETDNGYIPGWLVDISALIVDAYRSGKIVKVEGENDEEED